jgi:hypothetical protein
MLVTALLDLGDLTHPDITLAEANALFPGQIHQLFPSPRHQFGVGRKSDCLGLDRCINGNLLHVFGPKGTGPMGRSKAFLDKARQGIGTDPLTSSRH